MIKKYLLPMTILLLSAIGSNAQTNTFPSSGNVGIGTTNPSASLEVVNLAKFRGGVLHETDATIAVYRIKPSAANSSYINGAFDTFERSDINNSAYASFGIANTTWGAPVPCVQLTSGANGTASPKDIMIWANKSQTADNVALCIKANTHNIGIGTRDTKGYKLAVAGSTVTESLVIKLVPNWPDYVFHENYKLPSLFELENYIKENKHLPDVPSAATIAENGLNVVDMNASLLKKIEELTLYVIELKKEVELLKKETGHSSN